MEKGGHHGNTEAQVGVMHSQPRTVRRPRNWERQGRTPAESLRRECCPAAADFGFLASTTGRECVSGCVKLPSGGHWVKDNGPGTVFTLSDPQLEYMPRAIWSNVFS